MERKRHCITTPKKWHVLKACSNISVLLAYTWAAIHNMQYITLYTYIDVPNGLCFDTRGMMFFANSILIHDFGFNLWSGPWLVQHGCKPCKTRIEPWNVGILEAGVASLRECWSFQWNLNIGLTHLIVTVCISISLFVCVSPCLPIRPALSRFLCIYLSAGLYLCLPSSLPAFLSWLCVSVSVCVRLCPSI